MTNGTTQIGTNIPLPLLDPVRSAAALRQALPLLGTRDSSAVSSPSMSDTNCSEGQDFGTGGFEGSDKKRRRKQTQVPPEGKDQRYWARRLKNNEAAKRSRDMRIQREKLIFDENSKLENDNKELKAEAEVMLTENKELRLKMSFILEENARLQDIIRNIQAQQREQQQVEEEMEDKSQINREGINGTSNGM